MDGMFTGNVDGFLRRKTATCSSHYPIKGTARCLQMNADFLNGDYLKATGCWFFLGLLQLICRSGILIFR